MRIPVRHLPLIQELLEEGRRRRKLLERHRALSLELTKELDYFRKRVARMDYSRFRKQSLYIGSGIVEAACRTDVARRCKQAGMRWRLSRT